MQSLPATHTDDFSKHAGHPAFHSAPRPSDYKAKTIDLIGTDVAFAMNAQIYGEGQPSTYLYKLTSGLARSYSMTPDGRRQIVAFYVPGDLFGFEVGDGHTLTVEATTESRIRVIKRSSIFNAMSRDDIMAHELWLNINREVRRNQEHILQFGKPARVRVASFLLEIVKRVPSANVKALALSRQDIADYLDLRIETVSRAMTRLARAGAIAPSSRRRIRIGNAEALHQAMQ